MRTRKGIPTTAVVFLLVSATTIVTSFGVGTNMLESAFLGVSQQSESEFFKDVIKPNIHAACESDEYLDIPKNGNFSRQFTSYDQLKITEKNSWLGDDDALFLELMKDGSTKNKIRIDSNGWLHGWKCGSGGGAGRVHFAVKSHCSSTGQGPVDIDGFTKLRISQSGIGGGACGDPDAGNDNKARIEVWNEVNN